MKKWTTIALVIAGLLWLCHTDYAQPYAAATAADSAQKQAALDVLQTRCNTCHVAQNPGKVFTENNMNGLAARIYKQVFIKHRMPKGGAKLSDEEQNRLLNWIGSLLPLRQAK
ncbi:c-type cytochrome [Deminuibacter soli]|uniref:Cytochrome c domain-containing protein n=1 Tax=Deminuibacter soli TaxID=2291815 RepID=A0A3E1NG08_9BACT|nr:c-type cytochrome [Deminuibacter soli]RFM26812.1 hypothetical protein DXN05_17640 [Deminuibacter soli]